MGEVVEEEEGGWGSRGRGGWVRFSCLNHPYNYFRTALSSICCIMSVLYNRVWCINSLSRA